MKISMKQELINDVLTGLLVAATFAAVLPTEALADLSAATNASTSTIAGPAMKVVSIISYCLGAVLTVHGISGAKQHADNPASKPLGPAVGKLGAGAAFLAAPYVIGMIQETGTNTLGGSSSFNTITGF